MSIVPLPLPPHIEARALLHHLLEHGDIVGRDAVGRTVIQLAVDDWVLDKLMVLDAEATELEDGGEVEPNDAAEEDWLPVVLLDLARPKIASPRRRPQINGTLSAGEASWYPAVTPPSVSKGNLRWSRSS